MRWQLEVELVHHTIPLHFADVWPRNTPFRVKRVVVVVSEEGDTKLRNGAPPQPFVELVIASVSKHSLARNQVPENELR